MIEFPRKCPVCNGKTDFDKDRTFLYCINPNCSAKSFGRIEHFINSMDIKNIGSKTLEKIINRFNIENPFDLYRLSIADFTKLEGIELKSATKIYDNIQLSKNNDLWRVIWGLGIDGVGGEIAKDIANKYKSLNVFFNCTSRDIVSIDGIGNKIVDNIINFLGSDYGFKLVGNLIENNIGRYVESENAESYFNGAQFCITGSFDQPRKKIKEFIEEHGGVVKGLSSKTEILLAGDKAGSKLKKAKDMGIEIWDKDEWETTK
ncbi:MAG: helix-hairpin-helix domain-containing protein [Halanaerobiales bacterium]